MEEKDTEELKPKKVSESETSQLRVVIYPDINGFGRLFGGRLLAWIDEVAGATARDTAAGMRRQLRSTICISSRGHT